jgi:Na+/H+ antiporter NhaA
MHQRVNDALTAAFFFVVGPEVGREMIAGKSIASMPEGSTWTEKATISERGQPTNWYCAI